MDDETIDRVAKALQKAHYERGRGIAPPWPKDRFEQEMWFFSARAAIAAMPDPNYKISFDNSHYKYVRPSPPEFMQFIEDEPKVGFWARFFKYWGTI